MEAGKLLYKQESMISLTQICRISSEYSSLDIGMKGKIIVNVLRKWTKLKYFGKTTTSRYGINIKTKMFRIQPSFLLLGKSEAFRVLQKRVLRRILDLKLRIRQQA
jgi:hypothetical protein